MRVQHHPTHHDGYRPSRVLVAAVAAVAGVFAFLAALALPGEPGSAIRLLRRLLLIASGTAAVGGFLATLVLELVHLFDRCPECGGMIFRTRTDDEASYDPCRRCGVRWTCGCHKE